MAATIVEQPDLVVTRRDSLLPDDYASLGTHANYDAFPDGRLLMVRPLAATAMQRDRLFVVVNWPQLIEPNRPGR